MRTTRSRPVSRRPRSAKNARASTGSSCAISSSILAHTGTARVNACDSISVRCVISTASSARWMSASSRLITTSSGLAERNRKPRRVLAALDSNGNAPNRCTTFERVATRLECAQLQLEVHRRTLLHVAPDPLDSPLCHPKVGQDEFVFHRPRVARSIDAASRVRDLLGAKRPHDVEQRVRLPIRRGR